MAVPFPPRGLRLTWLRLALLVFCTWGGTHIASAARAEPLVRVRAESRIELGVTHQELGMLISGALRDELGAPLGNRPLALEAYALSEPGEPFRTQLTTDAHGRFALELPDPAQDYRLLATFAGDATHRGVRVERRVERTRADVRLELRLPEDNVIDLDAAQLVIEAIAESDAGGADIAMRLSDETGRTLATGRTDTDGRLTLEVPAQLLGAPGPALLRLQSARDERRAEAQTEARIVRRRAVFVELASAEATLEAGGVLRVRGKVHTRVAPRARVPVGLFAQGRHVETVITDEQGAFEAQLWLDTEPGPLSIQARTEADAAGAYPAAEREITLHVAPARPVPVGWILGAGLSALAALWLYARLRLGREANEPLELAGGSDREGAGPSVRPARAQGRRDRHRISGQAIDARSAAPIAGARVSLIYEGNKDAVSLVADAQGGFESPELRAGRAHVLVEAPGYLPTHAHLEIPHRGEWTAFVVKLESLRDRALSPFRRLALKALPSSRAWGIWTNREAREWLLQRTPAQHQLLWQLTLDVERACYGRDFPSEADVGRIERTAQQLETDPLQEKVTDSTVETRTVR